MKMFPYCQYEIIDLGDKLHSQDERVIVVELLGGDYHKLYLATIPQMDDYLKTNLRYYRNLIN